MPDMLKHIPDKIICDNATPSKLQIPGFETHFASDTHPPQGNTLMQYKRHNEHTLTPHWI
jgi:hypothetical protein